VTPRRLVPPARFAAVEDLVYRSSFPALRCVPFLLSGAAPLAARAPFRSIVSLTPEPLAALAPELHARLAPHCLLFHVAMPRACVAPDTVRLPCALVSAPPALVLASRPPTGVDDRASAAAAAASSVSTAVAAVLRLVLLLASAPGVLSPVLVHCLDGRSATGLVAMCLRRLLGWSMSSVLAENARFWRASADPADDDDGALASFVAAFSCDMCLSCACFTGAAACAPCYPAAHAFACPPRPAGCRAPCLPRWFWARGTLLKRHPLPSIRVSAVARPAAAAAWSQGLPATHPAAAVLGLDPVDAPSKTWRPAPPSPHRRTSPLLAEFCVAHYFAPPEPHSTAPCPETDAPCANLHDAELLHDTAPHSPRDSLSASSCCSCSPTTATAGALPQIMQPDSDVADCNANHGSSALVSRLLQSLHLDGI
jgi:hypothetical protein